MILFDVGANWGQDSLDRTRDDSKVITYAFEPTPELYRHLSHRSFDFSDRYFVHEVALSDFNGTAQFNVAAHNDWGTSSLLDFSPGLDQTWVGRHDFYVDRKIDVTVMRFDTWFEATKPKINRIDFFHCDTQGSDLRVLRGMGDYIDLIVEGVIEVPDSPEVMLYQGQHTKDEAISFLTERGFEISNIAHQQNEQNLFFRKIK